MVYNSYRFTTCSYTRSTKTNDSVIYKSGAFKMVTNICKVKIDNNDDVIIFFERLKIKDVSLINNTYINLEHIKQCELESNELNAILFTDLDRPCVLFKLKNSFNVSTTVKGLMGQNVN